MRPTLPRLLLAALVAVAFLAAGCGSSGSDAADDPTTTAAKSTSTKPADDTTTTAADDTTTTAADDTTTTAADAGEVAICAPMKRLAESDAKANTLVAGGDWVKIQAFYVDNTDDIVAIYDEAIGLDTEISPQLETLKSVTVSAGDLAASSSSLMDFSGKLAAQPNLAASGQAAIDANDYVQATCGFALAGF